MAGDRITDLYLGTSGEIFSPRARTEAIERIDWMVAQATGESVLDAGCSQGIATVLMAREGKRVVGLEPDAEALEYAQRLLSAEPAETRERVTFVGTTLEDLATQGERYDAVVCGEVLEHLDDASGFLEATWGLLRSGGVLVLTTPFAVTSHKDHKSIFFLTNFHALVSRCFVTQELFVRHKKIHFVGTRQAGPLASAAPPCDATALRRLLELTEQAVVDLERQYYLPRITDLRRQRRRDR
ncbi:MAG: methyltransferase domain-containing protein [Deltaproteobacteria bacterium]|nr:methyltransferase domain-containing protein [Deltaproteobacteria bacterium]